MIVQESSRKQKPAAVVHVDLDGARHIFRDRGWDYDYSDDPLFESGMRNLLAFLERNQIKATLFAIAEDLDDPAKREWMREAVRSGHEIASHTVTHVRLAGLTSKRKRAEIAESRLRLEAALQTPVAGFRAPSYDVDRECLDLLEEHGYRWDSSAFPTRSFAARLEVPSLVLGPHRPFAERTLLELPLPHYRPAPFPFHTCYALILGVPYFRWRLRCFRRTSQPLVWLFHLTDLAEPLPAQRLGGAAAKLYTLSHLLAETKGRRCQTMLDLVRRHYEITSTGDLLDGYTPAASLGAGAGSRPAVLTDRKVPKRIAPGVQPVVLAISTTHETGSALFEGAILKAAISEERLDRMKFSTQYPPRGSIDEVIRVAGVDPARISDVVVCGLPWTRLLPLMVRGQLKDCFEFHGLNDYIPHFCKVLYRSFYFYRALQYGAVRSYLRKRYGIRPRMHYIEHHHCHASAAYRTAPFDDALVVTADGVGDDLSITVYHGKDGELRRLKAIAYPHSFGQFYTACTQVLGFRGGRHEGKITGLSGFGKVDPELYGKVKSTIRRSGPDFALDKRYYSEGFIRGFSLKKIRAGESLFDALQYRNYKRPLRKLVRGYPREDVAAVFQQILEEEMEAVVRPFAAQTGAKNLALCGGVFANVRLNASLYRALNMERVYVFPHMGDGGLSVGAALEHLQVPPTPFDSVYWGPEYSPDDMEAALKAAVGKGLCYHREENIERAVAQKLVASKVVARFNGRMEFGPRALGNRSILYPATDSTVNDWLNKRLRRTEFMPFAPIVMTEHAAKLFKDIDGTEHACKFMTIILDCTDWMKEHCPAVVHVDGTARPQFVTADINPSIYRILVEYEALSGLPCMVNTSYNMHEEPIVCTPQDAVRAFLDSRLDYLAMGPFLAWLEEK